MTVSDRKPFSDRKPVWDRKTVSNHETGAPAFSQADWDEVSDNPDLTDGERAALRPARELPPEIYAALPRNRGGGARAASPKVQLTLRIDRLPPSHGSEPGSSGRKKAGSG